MMYFVKAVRIDIQKGIARLQRFLGLTSMPPLAFALALLAFSGSAFAADVTLAWEPNNEANIGGYKIYYGQASQNYAWTADVGNQTSYVLTDLTPGKTYFFSVTAYDRAGLGESEFASEVQVFIPKPMAAPTAQFTFALAGRKVPFRVDFVDKSVGKIRAWRWNFGDGSTSTSRNPSHAYPGPGSYTVSLTVTGPGGSNTSTNTFQLVVRGRTGRNA